MLIDWIKVLPRYRECASSGKPSPISSRDGMRRLMRYEQSKEYCGLNNGFRVAILKPEFSTGPSTQHGHPTASTEDQQAGWFFTFQLTCHV